MTVWGYFIVKYSIDMVRLRVELPCDFVEKCVDRFGSEPNCNYYKKSSIKEHRHNFHFEDYGFEGICSFWLGVEHNSRGRSPLVDLVLEYNPNKCAGSPLLDYILSNFYKDNPHVEVRKMDIAIDIPCNILDLRLYKDRRDLTVIDKGSDNKTYYVGARGSNGHIKLYNKSRESGLDFDLTRYELTITPKDYIDRIICSYDLDPRLLIPVTDINNFQLDFDLKGQDKLNIIACIDNPSLLSLLDKRKAKKIKDIISSISPVFFDIGRINYTVSDFLKTIFTL